MRGVRPNKIRLGDDQRSCCPLASFLDIFGDQWTLLVLRDLACGKSLFKEFLASPEKIATNTLADRLRRLTERGLVERAPSTTWRPSHAYVLTETGRSLLPVLTGMVEWGLTHIEGTEQRLKARGSGGKDS